MAFHGIKTTQENKNYETYSARQKRLNDAIKEAAIENSLAIKDFVENWRLSNLTPKQMRVKEKADKIAAIAHKESVEVAKINELISHLEIKLGKIKLRPTGTWTVIMLREINENLDGLRLSLSRPYNRNVYITKTRTLLEELYGL